MADVTWRLACARVCVYSSVTMCETVCVLRSETTQRPWLSTWEGRAYVSRSLLSLSRCRVTADPAGVGGLNGAAAQLLTHSSSELCGCLLLFLVLLFHIVCLLCQGGSYRDSEGRPPRRICIGIN